jgi:phenylalanyl-tRNA synthetase beta chain
MKFSYQLLKKLVPKIKSKTELIERLILHAFEATDLGGDTIDISIPANRYSDAASHFGLAKIVAAILNAKLQYSEIRPPKYYRQFLEVGPPKFKIEIKDKNLCPRYMGWYFEIPKITASPKWMQEILISCGLQPINSVVDIMNYAMLETGQPLHAFDYDKLQFQEVRPPEISRNIRNIRRSNLPNIIVRRAKKGEKITTLDGDKFDLNENILVITDFKEPLAIAGIKGGKKAEVTNKTKKIIVEAANFEPVSIYKTSRQINLKTDASLRFSHGLSPVLVEKGIKRAVELLKKNCNAKIGEVIDVNFTKSLKSVFKFDIDRFNKLTGLNLSEKICLGYLKKLGFKIKGSLIEAPLERIDISIFEDLVEEIVKLYGYNRIPSLPPAVYLKPSSFEELVDFKQKIRGILSRLGLNELYNYSFIGERDDVDKIIELENPISEDKKYLRYSLIPLLIKNVKDNFRFYEKVRIFEIGKTFQQKRIDADNKQINADDIQEKLMLGAAIGFKKDNPIPELKGLVEELLRQVGLIDYSMISQSKSKSETTQKIIIKSDDILIGHLGLTIDNIAFVEIDAEKLFGLAIGEKEFEQLSKYPSVARDLSILVPRYIRAEELMSIIENSAPKFLDDVDLIDVYEDLKLGENRQSLTFRLVFLADDHTLTNEEVGKEMERIISSLREEIDIEIR